MYVRCTPRYVSAAIAIETSLLARLSFRGGGWGGFLRANDILLFYRLEPGKVATLIFAEEPDGLPSGEGSDSRRFGATV